ncbi:MAG: hypothetical protein MUC81_06805 [Bacteroidia bacterium]|jgi:hypothetical protein|nr:hypothetical protein [Bacteroidia bacterium]
MRILIILIYLGSLTHRGNAQTFLQVLDFGLQTEIPVYINKPYNKFQINPALALRITTPFNTRYLLQLNIQGQQANNQQLKSFDMFMIKASCLRKWKMNTNLGLLAGVQFGNHMFKFSGHDVPSNLKTESEWLTGVSTELNYQVKNFHLFGGLSYTHTYTYHSLQLFQPYLGVSYQFNTPSSVIAFLK